MQGTGGSEGRQARAWVRAPDVLTALRFPLAVAFEDVSFGGGYRAIYVDCEDGTANTPGYFNVL